MPPPDTMYCAEQINIPPELPDILKQFTKAAIRTQPDDVLKWSAAYFAALSKGEALPVKERLEMGPKTGQTGLTPALLKVMHKQLSSKNPVHKPDLKQKWKGLCLPYEQLESILSLGNFIEEINWMDFFALGCSVLGGSLMGAMKHACEILTEEPQGSAARIPYATFAGLYTYLASLDGDIPQEQIDNFLQNLQESAAKENGMVQACPNYT